MFDRLAVWTSKRAGSAPAFGIAAGLVLIWLAEGLVISLARGSFSYFIDDKYQLQINTLTTVITFLLVVLLQYVTDKGDEAVNTKLDVIIGALKGASDQMAGVEKMTADELRRLHRTIIRELEERGPTP